MGLHWIEAGSTSRRAVCVKTIWTAYKSMTDRLPGPKDAQCVCFQYTIIWPVRKKKSVFQVIQNGALRMGLPVPSELVTMTLHFQAEGKDRGGFLVKHSSHSPLKTCLGKRSRSRLLHPASSAPAHSSHISLSVVGPSLQAINPLSDPTRELCKPLPSSSSSHHISYNYFYFGSISCQPG